MADARSYDSEAGAPLKGAPTRDDERHDDLEYNPQLEPRLSKAWINLLEEAEKAFDPWNTYCDTLDRNIGNVEYLANRARPKEFAMFWANAEVVKPSIYARPPQPVVVTKFKDRRPVYQSAAELLERTNTVAFDLARIDDVMKLIRDDVALIGRGVAWCRYEGKRENGSYYDYERVCIDYKHRRDFLHSVSRCWYEVTWVAAASYLTRAEARERFYKHSGDEYQDAEYTVDRDAKAVGGADNRERAKFWEVWDKANNRVVWVSKGCEKILDEDKPHLDLQNFFPCPQPAYGTLQRGSLVPVPDVLQYRDQLEELNLLTAKIHALSTALEAKGFYPSGTAELDVAIQAALAANTPGRVLVPIANWAAFGGTKEIIVWLPIDMIAQTITALVSLRKEIIQDIYQITGLSDIMRGATDPRETMGAQEMKSQFGSTRIRDKQLALVRMCRDLVEIVSDIITDKFSDETIIYMSQTQLMTDDMRQEAVTALQAQLAQQQQRVEQAKQMMAGPGAQQLQQNEEAGEQMGQQLAQAEQVISQGQQVIQQMMAKPTFDQVMHFLRDMRGRAFVLDIETDSTILIDENTEKQRRAEFTGVLAQLLPQLAQMIQLDPGTAGFCGEVLKFATAPFRVGRGLDGSIDDLVMQMEAKAGQPKGDDPTTAQNKAAIEIEKIKDKREREKNQADNALKAAELKQKDEHAKLKLASDERLKREEFNSRQQDDMARAQLTNDKRIAASEKHQADMLGKNADLQGAAAKLDMQREQQQIKRQDTQAKIEERQAMAAFKMTQPTPQPGVMR